MAKEKPKKNNYTIVIVLVIIAVVVYFIGKSDNKKATNIPTNTNNTVNQGKDSLEENNNGIYKLDFSDKFNTALASEDNLGLSILIAVDCSGSMKDEPQNATNSYFKKFHIASQSLTEIITFLKTFYLTKAKKENILFKVGLLTFNDEVKVLSELKEMNEAAFSDLIKITANSESFLPSGKTAIGDTLRMGTEILAQSGTIFKSFIIITDGENTAGIEPEEVLKAIVENKNNKTTKEFPVLTNNILISFIGFDIDSSVFSNLNKIGARVTSAANKTELSESLKNIFIADITKLEAR